MATINDFNALVIYRVGPVRCCSPSKPVVTVIPPPALTHPPGSSRCRPGIFRYGQLLVSILELRLAFGVDEAHWKRPGRVIVSEAGEGHTGFWVDDIVEVMETPHSGWGPLPPHLPRGIFSRTLLLDNQIHLYAEFDKLDTLHTPGYLRHYLETLTQAHLSKTHEQQVQTNASRGAGVATRQCDSTGSSTAANRGASRAAPSAEAGTQSDTITSTPTHQNTDHRAGVKPDSSDTTRPTVNAARNSPTSRHVPPRAADAAKRHRGGTPHDPKPISATTGPTASTPAAKAVACATGHERANTPSRDEHNQSRVASPRVQGRANKPPPADSPEPPRHQAAPANSSFSEPHANGSLGGLFLLVVLLAVIGGGGYWLYDLMTRPLAKMATVGDSRTVSPRVATSIEVPEPSAPKRAVNRDAEQDRDRPTAPAPANDNELHAPAVSPPPEPEQEPSLAETHFVAADANDEDLDAQSAPAPEPTMTAAADKAHRAATKPDMAVSDNARQTDAQAASDSVVEDTPADLSVATNDQDEGTDAASGQDALPPRALIQRDGRGITIILERSDDQPVFKTEADVYDKLTLTEPPGLIDLATDTPPTRADAMEVHRNVTQPAEPSPASPVTPQSKAPSSPVNSAQTTTIVHVVVKGDTLWDIAARYVNDPFRYPELARLSDIDNPHLIYPGDRVTIISRKHSQADNES